MKRERSKDIKMNLLFFGIIVFCPFFAISGALSIPIPTSSVPIPIATRFHYTLRDVITSNAFHPTLDESIPNLDKEINFAGSMIGKSDFIIFYFLQNNPNDHNGPLFISRHKIAKGHWDNANIPPDSSGKSIISFHKGETANYNFLIPKKYEGYFISSRVDTSEEKFLVLSDDLKLISDIQGKYLSALDASHFLYKTNEGAGFLNKPATVFLRDLGIGRDIEIYPRKPHQRLWLEYVKKQKAFFAKHPERSRQDKTSYNLCPFIKKNINRRVLYNPNTQALAFLVIFNNIFTKTGSIISSSNPTTVVTISRNIMDNKAIEHREIKPEELLSQFGNMDLDSLLEEILANPQKLKLIFDKFVIRN